MYNLVNSTTLIDNGFQLSRNFLIEHLTTGAYHPKIDMWLPIFTSKLLPANGNNLFTSNSGLPVWKIIQNLQMTSQGLLESLFNQIGSDLIIKTGFSLPSKNDMGSDLGEIMHGFGLSIDIQVKNYEDNPFAIAKDIAKLAQRASGIQMCFNNDAWFHLETTPNRLLQNMSSLTTPIIQTYDIATGVLEKGITSIRGLS